MRDGKIGKRVTVPTDARHGLDGIRATIESGVAAFRQDAYSAVGFSTARPRCWANCTRPAMRRGRCCC